MPMVRTGAVPLHAPIEGPEGAPALILSNSLATNLGMWDPQMPALARRFRVIRYDQRGHGRSAAPPGPYSFDALGRDALAVLDHFGIERAHWCGLSMGGMTGMWLLTHAPERIDRAVLANTSAHMPPRELWDGRIRTAERGGMAALVDATIARWFSPDFIVSEPTRMDEVRSMILGTPVTGYQGCCAAIRDMDMRMTIRAIDRPTLVIIGAQDPATTPAMGEEIAAAIPGARAVTLDAAHLSNIEQPEAFTRAVVSFLG